MGIVVLNGDLPGFNGELVVVAGECSGGRAPYIEGYVPVFGNFTSTLHGAWVVGEITDDLPVLSGDTLIGNGPFIEGELPFIDDVAAVDSLTGTSNKLALEDELPLITGELVPGGELGGELPLWEFTLTGMVPSVGSLTMETPVLHGESFAGAQLTANVPGIAGYGTATVPTVGTVSSLARLPSLSGNLAAKTPFIGSMSGNMPGLASFMGGYQEPIASLSGGLPRALSGVLSGQAGVNGALTGVLTGLDTHNSALTGDFIPVGNIDGTLPGVCAGNIHDDEDYYYGILRHVRGQVR